MMLCCQRTKNIFDKENNNSERHLTRKQYVQTHELCLPL